MQGRLQEAELTGPHPVRGCPLWVGGELSWRVSELYTFLTSWRPIVKILDLGRLLTHRWCELAAAGAFTPWEPAKAPGQSGPLSTSTPLPAPTTRCCSPPPIGVTGDVRSHRHARSHPCSHTFLPVQRGETKRLLAGAWGTGCSERYGPCRGHAVAWGRVQPSGHRLWVSRPPSFRGAGLSCSPRAELWSSQ